jgi:hypothetical protein
MRINLARIGSRISRKVPRIRILRSWRGYPVGAVIQPPAGPRQILLQAKDQLGNKVAELVEEPIVDQCSEEHGDVEIVEEPHAQRRVAPKKKKASDMAEMKEAGVADERSEK